MLWLTGPEQRRDGFHSLKSVELLRRPLHAPCNRRLWNAAAIPRDPDPSPKRRWPPLNKSVSLDVNRQLRRLRLALGSASVVLPTR